MMDPNPQCYIPSFREIGPLVPEKKFLYCIWAWWLSWSCDQRHAYKFSFPCTLKLKYKIRLKWLSGYVVSVWRGFLFLWVLGIGYDILLWHSLSLPYNVSEKSQFSFPYVNGLGPRSRNDRDLQYSHFH